MRIGITGHQTLRTTLGWEWIDEEIRRLIAEWCPPCVGISSLAAGADQHFARIVLEHGGALEVVVPFPGYETRFKYVEDRSMYERLLRVARAVLTLPRVQDSDELSYLAAGRRLVDMSSLVLAVWDGQRAVGPGGTADIVAYAESRGKKIVHINPLEGSVVVPTCSQALGNL